MASPNGSRPIWREIELSESYLVCSMFEEAASLSSLVLKRLCDKECADGVVEDIELNDMLESSGMVFVQSLKELGRSQVRVMKTTSLQNAGEDRVQRLPFLTLAKPRSLGAPGTLEIMNELMQLYNLLTAIPVQVFLTGVCFQMREDPHGVQKFLEEFLSKWRFVDEQYYVLASLETNMSYMEGCSNQFVLGVDAYLQVVEVYITLLTGILRGPDLAISWVEKAALPEQRRQELLRRLHSMHSSNVTSSQASTSALLADGSVTSSASLRKQIPFEGSSKILKDRKQPDGDDAAKQVILRYSGQHVHTFWWFRTINLKFGRTRFAVSNGSLLLTALMVLAYYFMRRKKYTLTSVLKGQALLVKNAVMDLWKLAFSYQVNPLAAIEPLQNPTHASR